VITIAGFFYLEAFISDVSSIFLPCFYNKLRLRFSTDYFNVFFEDAYCINLVCCLAGYLIAVVLAYFDFFPYLVYFFGLCLLSLFSGKGLFIYCGEESPQPILK
jgi:hypothetical protein